MQVIRQDKEKSEKVKKGDVVAFWSDYDPNNKAYAIVSVDEEWSLTILNSSTQFKDKIYECAGDRLHTGINCIKDLTTAELKEAFYWDHVKKTNAALLIKENNR